MTKDTNLSRAERNRIQLKADIVDAAFAEFSAQGYHQTAIADIAQRLGVGHGTFYRYFDNKRDILDHVIIDTMAQITALLAAENAPSAVSSLAEYEVQCRRIAKNFAQFAKTNPNALRLLLLEATSIDAAMTQQIFGLLAMAGKFTSGYLSNGIERGFLCSNLDTVATSQAIVGVILAGAIAYLANPSAPDMLDRYSDAAVRLIITGMRQN